MNRDALKSAARAAVVMPLVFAFAYTVIGQPQTSLFAAFGCFATLVLVEFGGRPRERLLAHVGLATVGALLAHVVACRGGDGGGRVPDVVLRGVQRLLRGRHGGSGAALHPAGKHPGTELGNRRPAPRMAARDDGLNGSDAAALAPTASCRPAPRRGDGGSSSRRARRSVEPGRRHGEG